MCHNSDFVHLHVHSEYSMLDGKDTPKEIVGRVHDIGQLGVAMTEHGNMFGYHDFKNAIKEINKQGANIKPVFGCEMYLTSAEDMRYKSDDYKTWHLLLLAYNQTGYKNLIKMVSLAYTEGFHRRPRIDKATLAQYSEGLICTSGCLASEVAKRVEDNDYIGAVQAISWYQDVFGKENFFLEVQYRESFPEQFKLNKWLIENAKALGAGLVATTDAHYATPDQYDAHDNFLCMSMKKRKTDLDRMRFSENTFYLTTAQQMMQAFSEVPEAIYNTRAILERVDYNFDDKHEYYLPEFPLPDGYTDEQYLYELCMRGMEWRYGDTGHDLEVVRQRIDYEFSVIKSMGFITYFLVVWDVCEFFRMVDIWWNVRGSGAGSVIAYVLGISRIEPMENGLYFERFLNPGRRSMPDIDIDIDDKLRHLVIEYTVLKYGEDHVAGIGTHQRMGEKSAIVMTSKIFGLDEYAPRINKHMETTSKPDIMKQVLNSPELTRMYDKDNNVRTIIDNAILAQGRMRTTGVHAAGIVISPNVINEHIPLWTKRGETGVKGYTQWDMVTVEKEGYLKVDYLGLITLGIMREAVNRINDQYGTEWNMENIPYHHTGDPELDNMVNRGLELIASGITGGIFQIEGDNMTGMLKKMRPKEFANIVAAISLYRPGPLQYIDTYIDRLHGKESVSYRHPKLKPILSDTYGIIIYQEQVMAIASQLFGYSPGEADMIRKAVGKKDHDEMNRHEQIFLDRAEENGISIEVAQLIWDDIKEFAQYGFNKAHATDYAQVCVQTAVLKACYTTEYMTALLQGYNNGDEKMNTYLNECNELGIKVLPPDINYSEQNFTVEMDGNKKNIRIGLGVIKGVDKNGVDKLIELRDGQPFKDFSEFLDRVDINTIHSSTMKGLMKAGAFRRFGTIYDLLASFENLRKHYKKRNKIKARQHETNQLSMFDMMGVVPQVEDIDVTQFVDPDYPEPEPTPMQILDWERELIGFYITARPTDRYAHVFRKQNLSSVQRVTEKNDDYVYEYDGHRVRIGGEIVNIRTSYDKNKNEMAFFDLQDYNPSAHIMKGLVFASNWEYLKDIFLNNRMVIIEGVLDASRGDIQIKVDNAMTIDSE